MWLTFSPVPNLTAQFYHISVDTSDWFANGCFAVTLLISFVGIAVLDNFGLRTAVRSGYSCLFCSLPLHCHHHFLSPSLSLPLPSALPLFFIDIYWCYTQPGWVHTTLYQFHTSNCLLYRLQIHSLYNSHDRTVSGSFWSALSIVCSCQASQHLVWV